jgi:hypothetical protein
VTFTEVVSPALGPDGGPGQSAQGRAGQEGSALNRYPLSSQQELWCAGEQLGAFGPRFVVSTALRITGHVDAAALQGALDDVVARHELLRTIVVRNAKPPYQQVNPPTPALLEVRDLSAATGRSRDDIAEELLTEAELGSVDVEELPLLRAVLARFDDRDSVLTLLTHHTACDGWSLHLIERDLAAFYAARTGERPLTLPKPLQYHEYTEWQQANTVGPDAAANMAYWHRQLDGVPVFTLPTDRPVATTHDTPYAMYDFVVDAAEVDEVGRLAKSARCSSLMVMLAAFNVLANRISGSLDPVINTMIHGRGRPEFNDTVGPFLNFLALRTDLAGCDSFRELITRTRNTCLAAYEHEVPIQHVEQAIPSLMAPLADPHNCDFIFGYFESPFKGAAGEGAREQFRIAEDSRGVVKRERASEQIPGGAAWNMGVASSGELIGGVHFNPEEFDERSVAEWVAEYCRILAAALADPDRDWKSL